MTSLSLIHTSHQSVSPSMGLIRCWDPCASGQAASLFTLGYGVYARRPETNLGEGEAPGG